MKQIAADLEGKTALVSGGTRGIGQSIAERLAQAGATVALNYASNRDAAEAAVARIEAAGGRAFAIQAKLGTFAQAEQLAGELRDRLGGTGLDILVNNIGGDGYGFLHEVDETHYDHVMNINLRGAFFLTKALYHNINNNGRVINISSAGSRLTDPSFIVYTMAKAALEAFTRVLAQDLGGRGITVNSVAPGFTAGETNAEVMEDPETANQVIEATALRRFGQPEEIADIVYGLASPLGRWVTAQNIDASGGFKL